MDPSLTKDAPYIILSTNHVEDIAFSLEEGHAKIEALCRGSPGWSFILAQNIEQMVATIQIAVNIDTTIPDLTVTKTP
jgi:hypothetical protein